MHILFVNSVSLVSRFDSNASIIKINLTQICHIFMVDSEHVSTSLA